MTAYEQLCNMSHTFVVLVSLGLFFCLLFVVHSTAYTISNIPTEDNIKTSYIIYN